MEEFTSQDPEELEPSEEITTDIPYQWGQEASDQDLFLSDQENLTNQNQSVVQMQEENLLEEVRQIKDLLKESSVETTTEPTTDYVQMLYTEVRQQNRNLDALLGSVITIGHDQQTIGVLSVGATILLIGALGVFFFLWRIR